MASSAAAGSESTARPTLSSSWRSGNRISPTAAASTGRLRTRRASARSPWRTPWRSKRMADSAITGTRSPRSICSASSRRTRAGDGKERSSLTPSMRGWLRFGQGVSSSTTTCASMSLAGTVSPDQRAEGEDAQVPRVALEVVQGAYGAAEPGRDEVGIQLHVDNHYRPVDIRMSRYQDGRGGRDRGRDRLHASGASLREIASSLELSHQRVHQLVEGGSWVTRLTWGSRGKKHAGGERREERFCSFCGRPQFETSKLVAGPGVWICDHCVRSATRVVTRAAASDADAMEPVPSDDLAARCNFRGRGPRRVDGLVRGGLHGRTICNRCLDLCNEVLEEDRGRVGKKRPLGQPPEPK